ncbi:polysaccharide biosynthesis C-terminal domain-containing protein [Gallicola sp. Sow4_E12]|uniref:polysaccharide biosynthesis C-terminal domain-containing protein n=1 Tax=Gallicola sp. Sow4_E12 TaxID=3438785 RepID=UPI003F93B9C9
MKILVTGSKGFVGKNLICELKNHEYIDIKEIGRSNTYDKLVNYTKDVDFIFNTAGENRSENEGDFTKNNTNFIEDIFRALKENNNKKAKVLICSSIQAERDNIYGKTKKQGEEVALKKSEEQGNEVLIYRLPNIFGKWSKPNFNTVIATFCHNITRDIPIQVNDPNHKMELSYIDDVVKEFISAMEGKGNKVGEFYEAPVKYTTTLGYIAKQIQSFKESRENLVVPDMGNDFVKKLYSTYLSFLPKDDFSYPLTMHKDNRGSFTEIIRTQNAGQFSVNISKPGITKGNHWHHTKNEKFVVVKGTGRIQFRKIDSDEVIEYSVSGDKIEVVDIPVGYTHNIINDGEDDLVTFMWVNECFDPENPDTYFLEV